MDYQNPSLSPEERAKDLLSLMTTEEKMAQIDIIRGVEFSELTTPKQHCSIPPESGVNEEKLEAVLGDRGIGYIHDCYSTPAMLNRFQKYLLEHSRLPIPCIFTGEALHGIEGLRGTIFPVPLALSASFDPSLTYRVGEAIGAEARSLGIMEILAPNLDLARELRWGRVEETFGEDPFLSSQMGCAIIKGEQKESDFARDDAVVCEPKHYCVHGIPEGGLNRATARVGRREIESDYLPIFEAAIREAGAMNVMACYNTIDREPVIASPYYLKEILRDRYGMKGVVRADWGAVRRMINPLGHAENAKEAICMTFNAGLDMQGCCDYDNATWQGTLLELLREGRVSMERLDEAVLRVLEIKFRLGLFENPYTNEEKYQKIIRNDPHRALSFEAAKKAMTLLKNEGVLPLSRTLKKIAVIGPNADRQRVGGYSSVPDGYEIPSVLEEIKATLPAAQVSYCHGCSIPVGMQAAVIEGQPHLRAVYEDQQEDALEEAARIAAECEVAIIVAGDNTRTSGEGHDRAELRLAGRQRELIKAVAATGTPTILILENGRAVDLSEENSLCGAILAAWFGGEHGARAIVETLFGENNPAGRLPISFPADSFRIPCYYSMLHEKGGMFEGAREALYPFGHGLSYSAFEYSDLSIVQTGKTDFCVSFLVKNISEHDGDEVAQLYLNDKFSTVATPPKALKGFKRISLKAGEQKQISFSLGFEAFKLMNARYQWVVEPGEFEIMIGASSRDIRLKETITIAH